MKATALLQKQHRKVEGIFKKLESGKTDAEPLLVELAGDLSGHMAIEQDLFYPTVRTVDQDMILESFEEHALAEIALKRLLATSPEEETFQAKVSALKDLIMHHVEEEEEELFPKVDDKLSSDENEALGKRMKAMFDEVLERGYEAVIPKGSKTSADIAEKRVLKAKPNGASA